jgi:hypothetical protein
MGNGTRSATETPSIVLAGPVTRSVGVEHGVTRLWSEAREATTSGRKMSGGATFWKGLHTESSCTLVVRRTELDPTDLPGHSCSRAARSPIGFTTYPPMPLQLSPGTRRQPPTRGSLGRAFDERDTVRRCSELGSGGL